MQKFRNGLHIGHDLDGVLKYIFIDTLQDICLVCIGDDLKGAVNMTMTVGDTGNRLTVHTEGIGLLRDIHRKTTFVHSNVTIFYHGETGIAIGQNTLFL